MRLRSVSGSGRRTGRWFARRSDKAGPIIARQLQRLDEELERIAAWRPLRAPFQIAYCPRAQPCPRRKLLLGHSCEYPVATQHITKRQSLILSHRLHP